MRSQMAAGMVNGADPWGALDFDPARLSAQAQEQARRISEKALASGITILETEPGKVLLATLVREVLLAPVSDQERQPQDAQWHAGRRVGQQEVVWMLFAALEAARRDPTKEL